MAKGNELRFTARLGKVNVLGALASHGAFPTGRATSRHVVMAREQARVIGQGQDAFDCTPERVCVASGKIATRRAEIRHEKRIMYEGDVAHDVSNRRQSMARGEQDVRLQIADVEDIAVGEQPVPL